jgi:hypothetical protein
VKIVLESQERSWEVVACFGFGKEGANWSEKGETGRGYPLGNNFVHRVREKGPRGIFQFWSLG